AAQIAADELPVLEAELARLREEQEQLGDRLRDASAAEAAARRESERASADLLALKAQLAQAAAGHRSVTARHQALRQAAADTSSLASSLDHLAVALDDVAEVRDRTETEALASGFGSLAAARSAVLAPDQQSLLNDQVASWTRQLTTLQAAAGAADLAGLDPSRADEIRMLAQRATAGLDLARQAEQLTRTARD